MSLRIASELNRKEFCTLWYEFLYHQRERGSQVHVTPENLESYAGMFDRFMADTSSGLVLFADDDEGQPIGVIMAGSAPNGLKTDDGDAGLIWGCYVRKGHRRKGIGRRLVEGVARGCRALGMSAATAECLIDDEEAQRFAVAVGFEPRSVSMIARFGVE